MILYPLNTHPTEAPAWFAEALSSSGIDADRLPLWHFGTQGDMSDPAALLLRLPPGYTLFRHGHPCKRVEVVLQGSLEVGDGRVATVGDIFTAEPYSLYGPHTAGPDGCTTLEIFSAVEGMFRLLYEGPDGEILESNSLRGESAPGYEPIPGYERKPAAKEV